MVVAGQWADVGAPLLELALSGKVKVAARVPESWVGRFTDLESFTFTYGASSTVHTAEIYSMQLQAILEAAAHCAKEGIPAQPEIMVPQVCTSQELKRVKSYVDAVQEVVENKYGMKVNFKFGSMMEVVRSCMRAGSLAEEAEFFSFGTNDLTQATFSFSREDAENKFLPMYNRMGILKDNPFEVLDIKGVGKLMQLAVDWGRSIKPDLNVGICGEHGGHPKSIAFCHDAGLDYVSCSAPRVPVARLAAAQACLKGKK